MKKVLIIVGLVLLTVFSYFLYSLVNFELFSDQGIRLKEFSTQRGERYEFYYFAGNAVTQDVLQLRKIAPSNNIEVVQSFEQFDELVEITEMDDNTIEVIMKSSVRDYNDTVILRLQ